MLVKGLLVHLSLPLPAPTRPLPTAEDVGLDPTSQRTVQETAISADKLQLN